MKFSIIIALVIANTSFAQSTEMKEQFIKTNIGEIAVQVKRVENTVPVIFLHGVYLDHNLWNYQTSRIIDRTVITLDMPLHGKSKSISKEDWSLDDCGKMLIEVLDELNVEQVIAVGHSWGSMTILRAASTNPERFAAIGFCNMPFEEASFGGKMMFNFQHLMLRFRDFYVKQAANAIFGSHDDDRNQELLDHLQLSMSVLSRDDIKATDEKVIIQAKDTRQLVQELKVPSLAIVGQEDYVPSPEPISTRVVSGGHVSPIEALEEVMKLLNDVIALLD